jgi:hypothetical protein
MYFILILFQVLSGSLKDAVESALNVRVNPRELVRALVRAESAALDENDCGPRAKPVMNAIMRNE